MNATVPSSLAPSYRPVNFGVDRVQVRKLPSGVEYVEAERPLGSFARRLTDHLLHWAETTPEHTLVARRTPLPQGGWGDWQRVSYAQALAAARSIGEGLLARGLNAERPVLILCENSIEHLLMALGCLYAGVPYCPVSTAYATLSQDFDKLRHVIDVITPGLVLATDGERFGRAIAATLADDVEVVLVRGQMEGRDSLLFEQLCATPATQRVDAAMHAVRPDTVAKFLFTSGSTKLPKAVVNTQRMLCANLQQASLGMPALTEGPPVLVDWLPWTHTFGGNQNVGLVLQHGGTLYIDDGKPTAALIGETLRNLREIAPTVYFNVPAGFGMIAQAMQDDAVLRRNLLSRLRMFFYSGAALGQPIWDSLHSSAETECGERIVMATALGMTETAPAAMFTHTPNIRSGDIGLPVPGVTLKLVPMDGKVEVRYRGLNITPGYWRSPQATREAFDEEGFLCSGDAVCWIDPENPMRGLRFDGRIAEDFKLSTGAFVSVGPLRARVLALGAPYIQDVVVTGLNQDSIGALLCPAPALREACHLDAQASWEEVMDHPLAQHRVQALINQLARDATGSANRIARAVVLTEPPSLDKGEITDKGSLNQRVMLRHREALVQSLYDGTAAQIFYPV